VDFTTSIARLNKRHIEEDEMEMEKRARQSRCAYEEAEKVKNLEWARCVAPSAAHILYRHFRHTGNEAGQTELSFGTIVLSLVHSGEQYIEDLAERLAESKCARSLDPPPSANPRHTPLLSLPIAQLRWQLRWFADHGLWSTRQYAGCSRWGRRSYRQRA
jgi:hypothetical protein